MIIEFIIGLLVGIGFTTFIFLSNNPKIIYVLSIITRNKQSMIKTMFDTEVQYEKQFKVKYRK